MYYWGRRSESGFGGSSRRLARRFEFLRAQHLDIGYALLYPLFDSREFSRSSSIRRRHGYTLHLILCLAQERHLNSRSQYLDNGSGDIVTWRRHGFALSTLPSTPTRYHYHDYHTWLCPAFLCLIQECPAPSSSTG